MISQLHGEMRENLIADPRFGERARDVEKAAADGSGLAQAVVAPRGRPLPGSGGGHRDGPANDSSPPAGSRSRARRSRTKNG